MNNDNNCPFLISSGNKSIRGLHRSRYTAVLRQASIWHTRVHCPGSYITSGLW